jgi:hypothetical protein
VAADAGIASRLFSVALGPARLHSALSAAFMPAPTINHSLEEIQQGALRKVAWLEDVIKKHPKWSWPPPVLLLAHEFQALAVQQPLDLIRIQGFTFRLKQHVRTHHLKGFEPFIWYAEALEYLAEAKP